MEFFGIYGGEIPDFPRFWWSWECPKFSTFFFFWKLRDRFLHSQGFFPPHWIQILLWGTQKKEFCPQIGAGGKHLQVSSIVPSIPEPNPRKNPENPKNVEFRIKFNAQRNIWETKTDPKPSLVGKYQDPTSALPLGAIPKKR